MCCRLIWNFITRCMTAFRHGFIEFCQKGCMVGSAYLVRPNYHPSERRLWSLIFLASSTIGFLLISSYMGNYSQNVYRIVVEEHNINQKFKYPTLAICEIGSKDSLVKVEQVLNESIYLQHPLLRANNNLKNLVNMLTFENVFEENAIRKFINYTKTLLPHTRQYLENYNYNELSNNITSNCSEFFVECFWLDEPFKCCDVFQEMTTMVGKCFMFNTELRNSNPASKLVQNIVPYAEPYNLQLTFNKPAKIALLNNKDIPENITPIPRYIITKKGTRLTWEFSITPMVNDESLLHLDSEILRCQPNLQRGAGHNKAYAYKSYTTCLTELFYLKQSEICKCIDKLRYRDKANSNVSYCTLSQFACLEDMGYINQKFMYTNSVNISHCLPSCDSSEYIVQNLYYSTDVTLKEKLSVEIILLNFPTYHKRRQAIRQIEDKIVSISGILGLFVGVNVVSMIEFIYLVCCAFWRQKRNADTQGVPAALRCNQIIAQP